jgi:tyrosine-protein kinase Etk/Wzc
MDLEKFFEEEDSGQEFSLDIRRYLRGLYKRKFLLLVIFLAIAIPWLLYVKGQPPEYEASTWIRFKNYDPEKLRILSSGWFVELTSRTFAEKVVAQLGLTLRLDKEAKKRGLMRHNIFKEFYTTKDPVGGWYKLTWKDGQFTLYKLSNPEDKENGRLVVSGQLSEIVDSVYAVNGFFFQLNPDFVQSNDHIVFGIADFSSAVRWFRSHVRIRNERGGTLLQLTMVHENPIIVARMVNSLAQIFVEESISYEKKRNLEYKQALMNQLDLAKKQLEEDQRALRQFKESHFISLDTDVQLKVEKLSQLEAQKKSIELNRDNLKELLSQLEALPSSDQLSSANDIPELRYIYSQIVANELFANEPSMQILGEKLRTLETQRRELLTKVTARHADVLALDQDIREVHRQIYERAKEKLTEVARQIRNLDRQIARLQSEIRNLPNEQLRLANLSKKVEISQKLYASLLQRAQELKINEAVKAEEVDILDPAIPPEFPKNSGKKKKAALGIFFAFFVAISVGIGLEFLDKTIKSPDDIKRHLGLEVIGSIPKIEFSDEEELDDAGKLRQLDSQLVTYDYSPTPVSEAYRALRTKILFSKTSGKLRTIVITSFAPGDGKSFTSSNLAVTLAQHRSSTLLVDADLRRGVQHNTFGIEKEPGLSNYLMGMVPFDEVVQETYIPNLAVISCGSLTPNPSELLGSIQLRRFIEEAKRRYDIVIFDTPPLNAATDAVVLGTQADGVVIIVRAEVTNRNVAKQKLELFSNIPVNLLGVVLNGMDADLAHEGYSYYHY